MATMLGKSERTTTKDDITRDAKVSYDEHLFFNFHNLDAQEVENAKILLSAENKGFFKGDLIGSYEVSVNKIYNMKNHCLMH